MCRSARKGDVQSRTAARVHAPYRRDIVASILFGGEQAVDGGAVVDGGSFGLPSDEGAEFAVLLLQLLDAIFEAVRSTCHTSGDGHQLAHDGVVGVRHHRSVREAHVQLVGARHPVLVVHFGGRPVVVVLRHAVFNGFRHKDILHFGVTDGEVQRHAGLHDVRHGSFQVGKGHDAHVLHLVDALSLLPDGGVELAVLLFKFVDLLEVGRSVHLIADGSAEFVGLVGDFLVNGGAVVDGGNVGLGLDGGFQVVEPGGYIGDIGRQLARVGDGEIGFIASFVRESVGVDCLGGEVLFLDFEVVAYLD